MAALPLIATVLEGTANDLDDIGLTWALVGGLAMGVWTEPRTTRDIDCVVSVSGDAETERAILALHRRGYQVRTLLENRAVGRLATVRTLTPRSGPRGVLVDLLFSSCGAEPEIADSAVDVPVVSERRLPVARPAHLLAMKLLSDRPARPDDRRDILALLGVCDTAALTEARALLALIQARGYHRGRDLHAHLESYVRADVDAQPALAAAPERLRALLDLLEE